MNIQLTAKIAAALEELESAQIESSASQRKVAILKRDIERMTIANNNTRVTSELQQLVTDAVLDCFQHLSPDDISPRPMEGDLITTPKAREAFPFAVRCQARATGYTPLYNALQPSSLDGGLTPLVIVKKTDWRPLVLLDLESFMKIVS